MKPSIATAFPAPHAAHYPEHQAGFEDLPVAVLAEIAKSSLSPQWIDDERANLRQLLACALVNKRFQIGIAKMRLDPELFELRSRSARKELVQWRRIPQLHRKLVERWGVDAVPRENFGIFDSVFKRKAQAMERTKETVYLRSGYVELAHFRAALDSVQDSPVTRLFLEEGFILSQPESRGSAKEEQLLETFLNLALCGASLSEVKEFHLKWEGTFLEDYEKYLHSEPGHQLQDALSGLFRKLPKLEYVSFRCNGNIELSQLIVGSVPDTLIKLELRELDDSSEIAIFDSLGPKLRKLRNLEELFLGIDIRQFDSGLLRELLASPECQWKAFGIRYIMGDQDNWPDLSDFFEGICKNQSLEKFSFEVDSGFGWPEEKFPGMLGLDGAELLRNLFANHSKLFDVHINMPLWEDEFKALTDGASRSASLRKLFVNSYFGNLNEEQNDYYPLGESFLKLTRENPRILSIESDPDAESIKSQLAANSRIEES